VEAVIFSSAVLRRKNVSPSPLSSEELIFRADEVIEQARDAIRQFQLIRQRNNALRLAFDAAEKRSARGFIASGCDLPQ